MTQDADIYHPKPGPGRLPLYEGKMIWQFQHAYAQPRYWVDEKEGRKRLLGETKDVGQTLDYQCYRLAFRDVAANTNERGFIATLLPRGVFCPHTMSLESIPQSSLNEESRLLCAALFNSFVADWLIRQRMTNHLSFFLVYQLPIPRLTEGDPAFRPLVERAARLIGTAREFDDLLKEVFGPKATHQTHGVSDPHARQVLHAEIDALVARRYDLTEAEFTRILGTFPWWTLPPDNSPSPPTATFSASAIYRTQGHKPRTSNRSKRKYQRILFQAPFVVFVIFCETIMKRKETKRRKEFILDPLFPFVPFCEAIMLLSHLLNPMNYRRLGLVAFVAVLLVFAREQARSSSEDGVKAAAVAAEFINAYVKAIPEFDGYLGAVAWVKKHPLASADFKLRLEERYRKALEDDPEMGYGSDAVLSAQDYPDAYKVESVRITGDRAFIELQGVPPVPLPLRMILIRDGQSWLVDGSGDLARTDQTKP